MSGGSDAEISPPPTDEEAVAIVVAVQALWPTSVAADEDQRVRDTAWKFSGRWWNRPSASRRDRPMR